VLPSQLPKPVLQVPTAQPPPMHAAVALGTLQALPQTRQLRGSLSSSVSQPLAVLPSQSPRPMLQADRWHTPAAHTALPPSTLQALPQAAAVGQGGVEVGLAAVGRVAVTVGEALGALAHDAAARAARRGAVGDRGARHAARAAVGGGAWVLVSQPLAPSPSQSPKGALQRPTPQRPATQAGVPLTVAHTVPQAPQWMGLVCTSMQPPPQQARPSAQPRWVSQPGTHWLPMQSCPRGQCSLLRQSTQARVCGLQRPPRATPASSTPASVTEAAQAWSSRQPVAQRLSVPQYWPVGQASRVGTHCTQRRVAVSHAGPPGSPTHWSLRVQGVGPRSPGGASTMSGAVTSTASLVGASRVDASMPDEMSVTGTSAAASGTPPTTELLAQPAARAATQSAIGERRLRMHKPRGDRSRMRRGGAPSARCGAACYPVRTRAARGEHST
jgi:hypothetical protein